MNPDAIAVLIPVVAVGGFFSWMIVLSISKAQTARLKAHAESGGLRASAERQEEMAAALEDLRREVAELAERVDFTERLLTRAREAEGGKPLPGEKRTAST
jgi:Tfp pilus assembly protein PilO